MPAIDADAELMTLINVFTVKPERADELLAVLAEATESTMKAVPGFVSASLHKSADGARVVNYAQWRSRADFDAMLQNPKAGPHMAQAAEIADSFEPIVCQVRHTFEGG